MAWNGVVPPGGFAGASQMTSASRAAWGNGGRSSSGRRRKSKSRKKAKSAKRKSAKRSSSRKLKFGSPAWRKKYMRK